MLKCSGKIVRKFILFIICIGLSSSFLPTILAQTTSPIDIFPTNSKPYGQSYEDHIKNYWRLMLSIPQNQNPMEDTTGERCTFGQEKSNSSVFYLSGSTGGPSALTCKMKAGQGIFIPIITVEASQAEAPRATIEELHKIAKEDQDSVTSLYLKINDREFSEEELQKFRTHTKEFEVMFPEGALFGASAGPSFAVADGYYVITEPLSPGNYSLHIKGSLGCLNPECTEPLYAGDIRYNLIVE